MKWARRKKGAVDEFDADKRLGAREDFDGLFPDESLPCPSGAGNFVVCGFVEKARREGKA